MTGGKLGDFTTLDGESSNDGSSAVDRYENGLGRTGGDRAEGRALDGVAKAVFDVAHDKVGEVERVGCPLCC